MATTRAALWGRLNSLCASDPFLFLRAQTPFDFTLQPGGLIDGVFRIEVQQESVIGGMGFTEERTDTFDIWLARAQNNAPQDMYEQLLTDVTSLTAAIVRDGAEVSGEYALVDGGGAEIKHEDGRAYAVARLTLPLNYEGTL